VAPVKRNQPVQVPILDQSLSSSATASVTDSIISDLKVTECLDESASSASEVDGLALQKFTGQDITEDMFQTYVNSLLERQINSNECIEVCDRPYERSPMYDRAKEQYLLVDDYRERWVGSRSKTQKYFIFFQK
jgi:hypothetical protein